MTTCATCTRRLRDHETHRVACTPCEHRMRSWLREIPLQLPLLDALLLPGRDGPATGTRNGGGRAHSPLPARGDVLTLVAAGTTRIVHGHGHPEDQVGPVPILSRLEAWTELIADQRGEHPPVTTLGPDCTAYLITHLPYALTRDWYRDMHRELGDLAAELRALTRTRAARHHLDAYCPHCNAFALVHEDCADWIECEACGALLGRDEYDEWRAAVMPPLYRTAVRIWVNERITSMPIDNPVTVRVLLLIGDQAEITAVADGDQRTEPVRYPAADIAAAAGVDVHDLPGMQLLADLDVRDGLTGWRRP